MQAGKGGIPDSKANSLRSIDDSDVFEQSSMQQQASGKRKEKNIIIKKATSAPKLQRIIQSKKLIQ